MAAPQKLQYNKIFEMLKSTPKDRKKHEINLLAEDTQNIPFFKKYIDEGDSDDTVGTQFYVIIQGKVGIYIRLPQKQGEDKHPPLLMVRELEGGAAFGELALLNNKPRLASIICHEDSHFAILDKQEFDMILKQKEEDQLINQMQFFAQLPIFKKWNFNLVQLLYINSFKFQLRKGDKVFIEGEEPNAVYIVQSGEFSVMKQIFREKGGLLQEHQIDNEFQLMRENIQPHFQPPQNMKISSIVDKDNELFGEEDIINKKKSRTFTVVCQSAEGELVLIQRRDFEVRVFAEQGAKSYLMDRLQKKSFLMNSRIRDIKRMINQYQSFYYNDQVQLKTKVESPMKKYETNLTIYPKKIQNVPKTHLNLNPSMIDLENNKKLLIRTNMFDVQKLNLGNNPEEEAYNPLRVGKTIYQIFEMGKERLEIQNTNKVQFIDRSTRNFHDQLIRNYHEQFQNGNTGDLKHHIKNWTIRSLPPDRERQEQQTIRDLFKTKDKKFFQRFQDNVNVEKNLSVYPDLQTNNPNQSMSRFNSLPNIESINPLVTSTYANNISTSIIAGSQQYASTLSLTHQNSHKKSVKTQNSQTDAMSRDLYNSQFTLHTDKIESHYNTNTINNIIEVPLRGSSPTNSQRLINKIFKTDRIRNSMGEMGQNEKVVVGKGPQLSPIKSVNQVTVNLSNLKDRIQSQFHFSDDSVELGQPDGQSAYINNQSRQIVHQILNNQLANQEGDLLINESMNFDQLDDKKEPLIQMVQVNNRLSPISKGNQRFSNNLPNRWSNQTSSRDFGTSIQDETELKSIKNRYVKWDESINNLNSNNNTIKDEIQTDRLMQRNSNYCISLLLTKKQSSNQHFQKILKAISDKKKKE